LARDGCADKDGDTEVVLCVAVAGTRAICLTLISCPWMSSSGRLRGCTRSLSWLRRGERIWPDSPAAVGTCPHQVPAASLREPSARAAWAVDILLHFATSTAAEQGTGPARLPVWP